MAKNNKARAVVFGSRGVNATGLIRSLGQKGIEATFVSVYDPIESKFSSAYIRLPKEKSKWISVLIEIGKKDIQKAAIFSTDDESAFYLDQHFEELKEYYFVPNAGGRMPEIADKTLMSEMAQEVGLRVAEFGKIRVDQQTQYVGYPVILKPYSGTTGSKGDIQICRCAEEWEKAIEHFQKKNYSEVMWQQLIESQDQYEIGIMGLALPDGRVMIPGVIKKLRSYPTGRGSTSYAQFKRWEDCCSRELLEEFVRKTGYTGLFDIELIISDSTAWFIEINYRNGQYGYTPTAAGYNLPYNWWRGMAGEEIEPIRDIQEIFYINERDDYLHVKHGEISRAQWMREFRGATAYGMYCPGDQRPFIRQFIKIPDRVKILFNNIVGVLADYFVREEWNIAIRSNDGKLLFEEGGEKEPFRVIPNSFRYWCADPFVITAGAKDYIFFEMFDRFKGKGVIGYREIEQNGKIGKMHKAYESKNHLSFPFIFEHNGDYYMMPESSYDRNLTLLKASHFPDKWEVVKMWFEGEKICDSVLFKNNNDAVFLLTQPVEHPYTHAKLNLYSYQNGEWAPCKMNPVADDRSAARMAGAVFIHNGGIIRPSQDCESYGDAVNFSRIDKVEAEAYEESLICRIRCSDLKLIESTNCYHGVHTYNSNDRYEVIDLKNKDTVRFRYLFSLINK